MDLRVQVREERACQHQQELEALQSPAKDLLALTEQKLQIYKDSGRLIEVLND